MVDESILHIRQTLEPDVNFRASSRSRFRRKTEARDSSRGLSGEWKASTRTTHELMIFQEGFVFGRETVKP